MKQRRKFSISRQKSYLTAGAIALAAVIAMAGIYYRENRGRREQEQEAVMMADAEWTTDDPTQDETAEESKDTGEEDHEGEISTTPGETLLAEDTSGQAESTGTSDASKEATEEENREEAAPVAGSAEPQYHFSASDHIGWPMQGDVILNYSMDQSVYFATLDQYKYNPALIIRGDVNDKVAAAADGQVISIETNAEIGQTVTIGIGDGYQTIYGQLKEIQLSPGDYVTRGDTIGFVSEPTKYYAVEGSNLYFAMTKEGLPVNPMDYFE